MRTAVALAGTDILSRFAAIVGERYAITDPAAQAPYLVEMRGLYASRTPMVLRPGSVAEVSADDRVFGSGPLGNRLRVAAEAAMMRDEKHIELGSRRIQ